MNAVFMYVQAYTPVIFIDIILMKWFFAFLQVSKLGQGYQCRTWAFRIGTGGTSWRCRDIVAWVKLRGAAMIQGIQAFER